MINNVFSDILELSVPPPNDAKLELIKNIEDVKNQGDKRSYSKIYRLRNPRYARKIISM
jgi:hypothetical protein